MLSYYVVRNNFLNAYNTLDKQEPTRHNRTNINTNNTNLNSMGLVLYSYRKRVLAADNFAIYRGPYS